MNSSIMRLNEDHQPAFETDQSKHPANTKNVSIRQLHRDDARALHALICNCPPLDTNSLYAYSLLATHFSSSSLVATDTAIDSVLLSGAVTGYIKPEHDDTYFLWQVAVSSDYQGCGIGSQLLDHVLNHIIKPRQIKFLETTISPDNHASHTLFTRFAARHGVSCQVEPFLSSEELQPLGHMANAHESEMLYRIGPW